MSSTQRWLRFATGRLEWVVPATAYRRTLPPSDPLPAEMELDGDRYPVVDLDALAGSPPEDSSPALLLVLAHGDVRCVVPAADVSGTIEVDRQDLAPLPWPYDGGPGGCGGVLVPEDGGARPVLVLDLAGLAQVLVKDLALAAEAVP